MRKIRYIEKRERENGKERERERARERRICLLFQGEGNYLEQRVGGGFLKANFQKGMTETKYFINWKYSSFKTIIFK